MTAYRYTNGNTPEQQRAADQRYREEQRRVRAWIDSFAASAGMDKRRLLALTPAIAAAYVLEPDSMEA
ncbi:hypothetical protein WG915_04875 [Corynebacterium sp. H128]|uniref:hypothetical protein n=1 Tax=Corynebacterium sp. H128 TaxID=3133427 RepID=UPI0030B0D2AC